MLVMCCIDVGPMLLLAYLDNTSDMQRIPSHMADKDCLASVCMSWSAPYLAELMQLCMLVLLCCAQSRHLTLCAATENGTEEEKVEPEVA